MDISKLEEREWRKGIGRQVDAFRKEIEAESPEWAADRRHEYLTGKLRETQRNFCSLKLTCWREAMREKKEDIRYWLLRFPELSPFPKQIEKIKKQIEWMERRHEVKVGHVTREMIDRAAASPIENLIDPGELSHGKMICPYHDDTRPSMMIKIFGYCFVCHKKMDSIDYLRLTRNMSFADAVRALQ